MTEDSFKYIVDRILNPLLNTSLRGAGAMDQTVKKVTEAGMCEVFGRYLYGDGARDPIFRIDLSEKLYAFNGKYYEAIIPEHMIRIVRGVMERLDIPDLYRVYSAGVIVKHVIDGLMSHEKCRFFPDRHYIAFKNGIYGLRERKLLPFCEKYLTDIRLDFDYKSDASHPLWDRKSAEIIPDPAMRDALQMFFGCLLTSRDEIKVEYICFIIGAGGNGKSVLVEAVMNTFGKDLFSNFSPEQLFRSQQSMYHLAELDGKLANYCDDVSNKDFSGGDFKSFVSGAQFEARRPYARNTFKVTAPYFICCANEMPPSTDDSEGFHRRLLVITSCGKTWSGDEKDPELPFKLRADDVRQAIFSWVLEGYYKVMECHGNIRFGESVKEAQRVIKEDSNSVRRWVRDTGFVAVHGLQKYDGRWRKLTDWYADYRRYCEDNGERSPQKAGSVGRLFRALGFDCERRSDGVWYCIGIESDRLVDSGRYDDGSVLFGEKDDDGEMPF